MIPNNRMKDQKYNHSSPWNFGIKSTIKVYINEDGFVRSVYFKDCTIEVEVDDETYEKLSHYSFYTNWKYVDNEFIIVKLEDDSILRERRQRECFDIIDNRSALWYKHLTDDQMNELNAWYEAWLKVTDTHIIPTKPSWL